MSSDGKLLRLLAYDNGVLHIDDVSSPSDAARLYKYVHKAIVDGFIPCIKPYAFKFCGTTSELSNSIRNGSRFSAPGRSLESIPQVANNLAKLIVDPTEPTDESNIMNAKEYCIFPNTEVKGRLDIVTGDSTLIKTAMSSPGYKFIQPNQHICTLSSNKIILYMLVTKHTGIATTKETASTQKYSKFYITQGRDTYFYMNVNYSLIDCIRILPPTSTFDKNGGRMIMNVKFLNGLTPEMFLTMWEDMFNYVVRNGKRAAELLIGESIEED